MKARRDIWDRGIPGIGESAMGGGGGGARMLGNPRTATINLIGGTTRSMKEYKKPSRSAEDKFRKLDPKASFTTKRTDHGPAGAAIVGAGAAFGSEGRPPRTNGMMKPVAVGPTSTEDRKQESDKKTPPPVKHNNDRMFGSIEYGTKRKWRAAY